MAVIDPHGDLAESLLDYIPNWRIYDLVYFNPADREKPLGFNLLEDVALEKRPLVTSGIISAFKNIWSSSWGPRMEYYLSNTVATLLDYERPATLLGIYKLLVDERFRSKVTKNLKDPMIRMFWQKEFAKKDKRFIQEAIAPIQNKVGQFLMSPTIRNIVGQPKTTFSPQRIMDNHGIFIANLSKGQIGEDKAFLLGSLLVTKFQLSAIERAKIPEEERKDFFLHIDEVQNFINEGFLSILSESRKYRLGLSLSHQYLDQLGEETRKAILGNVGTLISFRVGSEDAEVLAKEFDYNLNPETLMDLDKFNIYLKVMVDGVPSGSHSAHTYEELGERYGQGDKMKRVARARLGRPRAKVEATINRWLG